jgi:hypothetical protein
LYAFLRNVVGSMDYTPVAFDAALQGRDIPYAHSLALSVLFESGLVHFADRADGATDAGYGRVFADFPFVRTFLEQVPTVWDDTRLLAGDPAAGHVALARRAGERWYLAAIQGNDVELALDVPLRALALDGPRQARCIASGDAPDQLEERDTAVSPADVLSLPLGPRDGAVCVLEAR